MTQPSSESESMPVRVRGGVTVSAFAQAPYTFRVACSQIMSS